LPSRAVRSRQLNHDALLGLYAWRFDLQVEWAHADEVLEIWKVQNGFSASQAFSAVGRSTDPEFGRAEALARRVSGLARSISANLFLHGNTQRAESAVEIFRAIRFAHEGDMACALEYFAGVLRTFPRRHDNRQ
jgi:hypothetical protein